MMESNLRPPLFGHQRGSQTIGISKSCASAGVEQLRFQSSVSRHGVELLLFSDRVPTVSSNIGLFQFEPWFWSRSFGVKIRGLKPENLGFHLASCNMQLLANYTKYYTVAIFTRKSLIYMGFRRAWIPVNP